jgi:hypothetical protein
MNKRPRLRFHMGCGEPLQIRWRVTHSLASHGDAKPEGDGRRGRARAPHGGGKSKS